MPDGVGIVIPAFRPDPERLTSYVDALNQRLQPEHIHIELDAPTTAVLTALESTDASVHVASNRRGKGAAITAGFEYLDTPIRCFVDADGSTPPESVEAITDPLAAGDANLCVGSRRHPDASVSIHQTMIRRRLGDAFARLARVVLPIALYDYQCGAKAIDATTWQSIRGELRVSGFAWDIELVAVAAATGARVVEIPIRWEDRPGSTVPVIGTASEFLLGLIVARHRAKCIQGSPLHCTLDRIVRPARPLIDREDVRGHSPTAEGV